MVGVGSAVCRKFPFTYMCSLVLEIEVHVSKLRTFSACVLCAGRLSDFVTFELTAAGDESGNAGPPTRTAISGLSIRATSSNKTAHAHFELPVEFFSRLSLKSTASFTSGATNAERGLLPSSGFSVPSKGLQSVMNRVYHTIADGSASAASMLSMKWNGQQPDAMVFSFRSRSGLNKHYSLNLDNRESFHALVDRRQLAFEASGDSRAWLQWLSAFSSTAKVALFPSTSRLAVREAPSLGIASDDANAGGCATAFDGTAVVSIEPRSFHSYSCPPPPTASGAGGEGGPKVALCPKAVDTRWLRLFFTVLDVLQLRASVRTGGKGLPVVVDGLGTWSGPQLALPAEADGITGARGPAPPHVAAASERGGSGVSVATLLLAAVDVAEPVAPMPPPMQHHPTVPQTAVRGSTVLWTPPHAVLGRDEVASSGESASVSEFAAPTGWSLSHMGQSSSMAHAASLTSSSRRVRATAGPVAAGTQQSEAVYPTAHRLAGGKASRDGADDDMPDASPSGSAVQPTNATGRATIDARRPSVGGDDSFVLATNDPRGTAAAPPIHDAPPSWARQPGSASGGAAGGPTAATHLRQMFAIDFDGSLGHILGGGDAGADAPGLEGERGMESLEPMADLLNLLGQGDDKDEAGGAEAGY